MAYDRNSTDGNASVNSLPKLHWTIAGCMVPIYNDGDLIKCVGLCWEWALNSYNEYEIIDVIHGSIDGLILPEADDIRQAIQEEMGLGNTLIFPDKFTHNPAL